MRVYKNKKKKGPFFELLIDIGMDKDGACTSAALAGSASGAKEAALNRVIKVTVLRFYFFILFCNVLVFCTSYSPCAR